MRPYALLSALCLASALLAASASTALAQTAMAQNAMSNATGEAASGSAATGYSLDTPIETLVADPAAKAVLDRDMPGLTTHPSYEQFKTMSLKEVQPMSDGKMTDQAMARTAADLAKLPPPK